MGVDQVALNLFGETHIQPKLQPICFLLQETSIDQLIQRLLHNYTFQPTWGGGGALLVTLLPIITIVSVLFVNLV